MARQVIRETRVNLQMDDVSLEGHLADSGKTAGNRYFCSWQWQ
jgi:hypothetical protein